jgi:hypothetical protein
MFICVCVCVCRGGGQCATSQNVAVLIPDEITEFLNWLIPSSRSMVLGSIQPLAEMSTRNLFGDKGRPALKADNPTAISEPVV